MSPTIKTPAGNLGLGRYLTTKEACELMRYENECAFVAAVKAAGIPRIQVNKRRWLFEADTLLAWLESKTVGSVPREYRKAA